MTPIERFVHWWMAYRARRAERVEYERTHCFCGLPVAPGSDHCSEAHMLDDMESKAT